MDESTTYLATGRRKSSIARVRLKRGTGQIVVNDKDLDVYFCIDRRRNAVLAPLKATKTLGKFDISVNVKGGGVTGQADAVQLGIARALKVAVEEAEQILRDNGYLTRDSRQVERKKYGLRGARRGYQWAKR